MEEDSFVTDSQQQSLQSKRDALKLKTKSFWASSRGKIAIVWSLTLTVILAIYIMIPGDNERALEALFLVSTLLGKLSHIQIIILMLTRNVVDSIRFNRLHCDCFDQICKP